ncbi:MULTISPECIES: NAD(P)-dependent alcohol dehydrogenase [Erwiniaceae]|uniref:zinc-dependent alcohol dehydrogenase family protein n=1 Tax=Erwiniaceae TaxID=1903409 RepID=UPI00190D8C9A|nr:MULTISPECIES: NAD(P)-dependent alcohol dehydrogenase [Erwiniaceae]MBK0090153.1 NAD(P)-dependent alcohol dehydrogenase [Erwinia sp. S59]MBK0125720.1 NAD(P)-dependent alcohol dehydrogenase [Pantoea sp. S61]
MRAIQLTAPNINALTITELPRPLPGQGEVLIRQHAVSLNYLDLALATGQFGDLPQPIIPGADSAGEIVELGAGVHGWEIGEPVIPGMMHSWHAGLIRAEHHHALRGVTGNGGLAEFAVVPAASLVRIPEFLSWQQAATLPIAATTAWNAIVRGKVQPGSTVLLLGTGGVSLFALQYAKAAGARVIMLSSSDEKLAKVKALGADEGINYRDEPEWDKRVLALTHGQGADLVLESVGATTFAKSINAAAYNGTIFVIGFVGGAELTVPVLPIMQKMLNIVGNNTGSTADLRQAVRAIEVSGIVPEIDRVFTFAETQQAYRYLQSAGHVGKVVIDLKV